MSDILQLIAAGKKAVGLAPDSAAANFWFANSMAEYVMQRGMMNCLDFLEPIEKHGKRALELDETFFHAGPLRLLGWLYSKAPVAPVGPGNRKKGLELARRAVEAAPEYPWNTVVLADAYLSARYFDEAREQLGKVLAAPEPGESTLEHTRCRTAAAQILERLEYML